MTVGFEKLILFKIIKAQQMNVSKMWKSFIFKSRREDARTFSEFQIQFKGFNYMPKLKEIILFFSTLTDPRKPSFDLLFLKLPLPPSFIPYFVLTISWCMPKNLFYSKKILLSNLIVFKFQLRFFFLLIFFFKVHDMTLTEFNE